MSRPFQLGVQWSQNSLLPQEATLPSPLYLPWGLYSPQLVSCPRCPFTSTLTLNQRDI